MGRRAQASKMQAKLSLALRTAVIAPRFSPYTPTSAPKPLCRPSTMLKAIFFFGSSEDGHSCVPKPPPAPRAWSFRGGLSDALGHGGRFVPGAAAAAGPRSRGTSSGLGTHLCESSRFVASLLMLQSFMAAVDARERPASTSPACAACRW